jgi:hypothetical protein
LPRLASSGSTGTGWKSVNKNNDNNLELDEAHDGAPALQLFHADIAGGSLLHKRRAITARVNLTAGLLYTTADAAVD